MEEKIFKPGDRVMVFDYTLFKDDKTTPLSYTVRPATIVRWYGSPVQHFPINDCTLGPYESLIDVVFDHRPERESHGHFTTCVKHIQ